MGLCTSRDATPVEPVQSGEDLLDSSPRSAVPLSAPSAAAPVAAFSSLTDPIASVQAAAAADERINRKPSVSRSRSRKYFLSSADGSGAVPHSPPTAPALPPDQQSPMPGSLNGADAFSDEDAVTASYKARERAKRRRRSKGLRSKTSKSSTAGDSHNSPLPSVIPSIVAAAPASASASVPKRDRRLASGRSSSVFNFEVPLSQFAASESPLIGQKSLNGASQSLSKPVITTSPYAFESSANALIPFSPMLSRRGLSSQPGAQHSAPLSPAAARLDSGHASASASSPTAADAVNSPITGSSSSSVSKLTVAIEETGAGGEIVRLDRLDYSQPPLSASSSLPSSRFGVHQVANGSFYSAVPNDSATPRSPSTRYRCLSSNPGTAASTPMANSQPANAALAIGGHLNIANSHSLPVSPNTLAPVADADHEDAASLPDLTLPSAEFNLSPNLISSLTNFSIASLSQPQAAPAPLKSPYLLPTPSQNSFSRVPSEIANVSATSSPYRFGRSLTVNALGGYSASNSTLPSPMQNRPSINQTRVPSVTHQGVSLSGSLNPSALNSPLSRVSSFGLSRESQINSNIGAKYYSFYKRQFSLQNEGSLDSDGGKLKQRDSDPASDQEKVSPPAHSESLTEAEFHPPKSTCLSKSYNASSRVKAQHSSDRWEGAQSSSVEAESDTLEEPEHSPIIKVQAPSTEAI